MKTLQFVTDEIDEINRMVEKARLQYSDYSLGRKLLFLTKIKNILEMNPRIEHLQRQRKEIELKIDSLEKNYETWRITHSLENTAKIKNRYHSAFNLDGLYYQLEMLEYILGE